MANLPTTTRITQEELQGDADQKIEAMLRPLNLFFTDLNSALNKDLTIGENIDAQLITLRIKAPDAYPVVTSWEDYDFQITMKRKPSGAYVINLVDVNDINAINTNPVSASIKFLTGAGRIKWITGLQPCHSYDITLLIL